MQIYVFLWEITLRGKKGIIKMEFAFSEILLSINASIVIYSNHPPEAQTGN